MVFYGLNKPATPAASGELAASPGGAQASPVPPTTALDPTAATAPLESVVPPTAAPLPTPLPSEAAPTLPAPLLPVTAPAAAASPEVSPASTVTPLAELVT